MKISHRAVAVSLLAIVSGCGGGDGGGSSNAPAPVVVTPTPSPSPSPSPSPTATPTPAPTPLSSAQLLQSALNQGAPLAVQPVPLNVTLSRSESLSNRVLPDSPLLRLLGGTWKRSPVDEAFYMQAITFKDPTLTNHTGLPEGRYGLNGGIEFVLPAGVGEFEIVYRDAGDFTDLLVAIDGLATSSAPYELGVSGKGGALYARVQLPAANADRVVRLGFGNKPLYSLNLPQGVTLPSLPTRRLASVVFEGDSITEGAVSSHPWYGWPLQAAHRLGIADPIVVGIGGTGYLRRRTAADYVFRQRIENVTKAVNGGPPEAVVVAGGLNDCSVAPPTPFAISEVGSEALAYFQALRAAAPQMIIFVLGPFTDYNNPGYSSTSRECRDAIFAAARQVPMTYTIDVADWVTPVNRDTVFDGNRNGPHPVDAGHAIYGERAAQALRSLILGL